MEKRWTSVKSHQERILLEKLYDSLELLFGFDTCVRENNLSLETAVLTADLEFLGLHLEHLQIRVPSFDKFNCVYEFLLIWHGCWGKNGEFRGVIGQDIEEFSGCLGICVLTECGGLIDKENDILSVQHTNVHGLFSLFSFILHDLLLLLGVVVVVQHFMGTMEIWNDKINDFLISTGPRINNSGIKVCGLFDWSLHRCKGEFLFFVVSISSYLHSHRSDQTRINYLHFRVFLVNQFTLIYQLWQGDWSTGLTTTNHSFVKDKSRVLNWALFIKGAFYGLDELDLAVVRLDVQSREKSVIVCVIHQLRVLNHDYFVVIFVVILKPFNAILEIQY